MEILEAYKVFPLSGNIARIYEFRVRRRRLVEKTNKAGQTITKIKKAKATYILVAAENLSDAAVHLRTHHPELLPSKVEYQGCMQIESRDKPPGLE